MPTSKNYPSGVDTFQTWVDDVDTIIAASVNDVQDQIVAIETALGTNPQGTLTDLKTRLAVSINNDGTLKTSTQGVTGLQGTTGIQGLQGVTGVQGLQGETGVQGQTGVQGVTGLSFAIQFKNASSVTLNNGTTSNTVSDLQTINDGNVYDVTESSGTPGLDLEVNFTNVAAIKKIYVKAYYAKP